MDIVQWATFGIAVLGAVLGILNTWQNLRRDSVRLEVQPAHAIAVGMNPEPRFCITVVNAGSRAVTLNDVGFRMKGTEGRASLAMHGVASDGTSLPRKLEPLSSVTFFCFAYPAGSVVKDAYASTLCGRTFTGSSEALRQVAKQRRFVGE